MAPGWEERVTINVKDNVVQSVSWVEDDGKIIDYYMTFGNYWIWEERHTTNKGALTASDAEQYPAVWLLKKEMAENENLVLKIWPTECGDPTERVNL